MDRSPHHLARNVTRLSHLDLAGAGQVTVAGDIMIVNSERNMTPIYYAMNARFCDMDEAEAH